MQVILNGFELKHKKSIAGVVTLKPVGIPVRKPCLTYMHTPKMGNCIGCVLTCAGHEHGRIVFTTFWF